MLISFRMNDVAKSEKINEVKAVNISAVGEGLEVEVFDEIYIFASESGSFQLEIEFELSQPGRETCRFSVTFEIIVK